MQRRDEGQRNGHGRCERHPGSMRRTCDTPGVQKRKGFGGGWIDARGQSARVRSPWPSASSVSPATVRPISVPRPRDRHPVDRDLVLGRRPVRDLDASEQARLARVLGGDPGLVVAVPPARLGTPHAAGVDAVEGQLDEDRSGCLLRDDRRRPDDLAEDVLVVGDVVGVARVGVTGRSGRSSQGVPFGSAVAVVHGGPPVESVRAVDVGHPVEVSALCAPIFTLDGLSLTVIK